MRVGAIEHLEEALDPADLVDQVVGDAGGEALQDAGLLDGDVVVAERPSSRPDEDAAAVRQLEARRLREMRRRDHLRDGTPDGAGRDPGPPRRRVVPADDPAGGVEGDRGVARARS